MGDILFSTLERFHGVRSWGRFLDAGTGIHSVKWMQSLGSSCSSFTAVTADNGMCSQIMRDADIQANMRGGDRVLVGNWMDENFCSQIGTYDTILADYLIGAVDGFSPYEQDTIIHKLHDHLNPNGRLYFIGMNPIPDETASPACIISEVRRARDSCILLAGHRPYREFPLSWIKRHLEQARFKIVASKNFTILHSEMSTVRQIRVAQSKLSLIANNALKAGMEKRRVRDMMKLNDGKIPLSFDYVIAAERIDQPAQMGSTTMMYAAPPVAGYHPHQETLFNMSNMAMMTQNPGVPMYPMGMGMDAGVYINNNMPNNMATMPNNMPNNMLPYNQSSMSIPPPPENMNMSQSSHNSYNNFPNNS